MVDIALNFRTGYIAEGHFVSDDWLVARAYLKGSFVMDVAGTFPLNIVMMVADPSNAALHDKLAFRLLNCALWHMRASPPRAHEAATLIAQVA